MRPPSPERTQPCVPWAGTLCSGCYLLDIRTRQAAHKRDRPAAPGARPACLAQTIRALLTRPRRQVRKRLAIGSTLAGLIRESPRMEDSRSRGQRRVREEREFGREERHHHHHHHHHHLPGTKRLSKWWHHEFGAPKNRHEADEAAQRRDDGDDSTQEDSHSDDGSSKSSDGAARASRASAYNQERDISLFPADLEVADRRFRPKSEAGSSTSSADKSQSNASGE